MPIPQEIFSTQVSLLRQGQLIFMRSRFWRMMECDYLRDSFASRILDCSEGTIVHN